MASPKADGRMIRRRISESDKFASLSERAAVLFCMLIPNFNTHGKMNGGVGYIKEVVCPKIPYLTVKNLPKLLQEINDKTNVKWFQYDGRYWLHSLNFLTEHQDLRKDRQGADDLPDYSGTSPGIVRDLSGSSPGIVPPEVEVEVKEKREGKSDALKEELKPENPTGPSEDTGEDQQPEPCALDEHAWQQFRQIMPLRHGKFFEEDACRALWSRFPGRWNQWLSAARNYAASREVQDGAVCKPLNFLTRKWQDWLEREDASSGAGPPGSAPDYSWMNNLQADLEKIEQEQQTGTRKGRPKPSWETQPQTI